MQGGSQGAACGSHSVTTAQPQLFWCRDGAERGGVTRKNPHWCRGRWDGRTQRKDTPEQKGMASAGRLCCGEWHSDCGGKVGSHVSDGMAE